MDMRKYFEMVCHDWAHQNSDVPFRMDAAGGPVMLDRAQRRRVGREALNRYMHAASSPHPDGRQRLRAFSGTATLGRVSEDTLTTAPVGGTFSPDLGWQASFARQELGDGQLSWEMTDVGKGLAFSEVAEGGEVKISSLVGEKQTVHLVKYGLGIGLTWEMVTGRQLYRMAQMMERVRGHLYEKWADVHYQVLAAAGKNNTTTWAAGSPSPLARDAATIVNAHEAIAKRVKGKGYGDPSSVRMQLYVGGALGPRVTAAIAPISPDRGRRAAEVPALTFPVDLHVTYNSAIPANKGLLVFPGQMIQNAVHTQEMGFSENDIRSLSQVQTYWSVFGAACGDKDQIETLSFA